MKRSLRRYIAHTAAIGVAVSISAIGPGASCASAQDVVSGGQNVYVELARRVVPSVVNISTLTTVRQPSPGGPQDPFRRFFEDFFKYHGGGQGPRGFGGEEEDDQEPALPGRKTPQAMSLGTGFIIDSSGLIITNNHVVAGADEIKITFTEDADEKPTDGEVVGRDPELDVALIKVKSKREMVPLVFGDSDKLAVGEYVAAVGNPFGQGHSVTHGIISAKGRVAPDFPLARYIQTDAPINPGNSGGPLVNLRGEVIGINNAIDQRAQGIGFAIPINAVKSVLEQLKTKGNVARGYIGVLVNDLTPEVAKQIGAPKDLRAPFVTHVYPGEPADRAGLRAYDVILEFAGRSIRSFSDLISSVTAVPVGTSADLKILRQGKEKVLKIQVSERPGARPEKKPATRSGKKEKDFAPPVDAGVMLRDLSEEDARELGVPKGTTGVLVESVAFGGPADQAGLMRGDLIVEADRKPIKSVEGFYSIVKSKRSYLLRVRRLDPQGRDAFTVVVLELK
ncbi:PDZ domain-containing protein [bacterium]|nr:PDZ domain-containing protein [bacterium]